MSEIETTRTGPSIKRGKSAQDYETPKEFIEAVEKRFGRLEWDLAANAKNKKALNYFGPDHKNPDCRDALSADCDWDSLLGGGGTLWLNPPFANIEAWAKKCCSVRFRRGFTVLLTPASIGTDWFREYVRNSAFVLGISPRLTFEKDPYPKDLMISVFGYGLHGFDSWRWDT